MAEGMTGERRRQVTPPEPLPVDGRDVHRICILIRAKVRMEQKWLEKSGQKASERHVDLVAAKILYYKDLLDRLAPFADHGADHEEAVK